MRSVSMSFPATGIDRARRREMLVGEGLERTRRHCKIPRCGQSPFGLTVLAALVAAGLGAIQAADAVPVTIAVLRGDGVLIPIATRTGTKWSHTWPVPAKAADVPLGLDGIPKRWWGKAGRPAPKWHAWQIDGTTTDVVVERPTWYLAHCQQGVGLKTSVTARPPVPPPDVQPYPKLGLAATSRRAVPAHRAARPECVDLDARGRRDDHGDRRGRGQDGRQHERPRRGAEAPDRRRPSAPRCRPESSRSIASPLGRGRFLYYVEATKRYGMPPLSAGRTDRYASPRKDGCSVMTFAEGWFVAGAEGTLPTPPKLDDVRLTSCDYDDVWLMLPLGYIADGANPLWIAPDDRVGVESYVVLRWDTEKAGPVAVFHTPGGWCADRARLVALSASPAPAPSPCARRPLRPPARPRPPSPGS